MAARSIRAQDLSIDSNRPRHRSLATEYPAIARRWHPTLNGDLRPKCVMPASHKSVWWLCSKQHAWKAQVYNRTIGERGCPYCAGQALLPEKSLAACQPALAAEWHPTKNGKLKPTDVAARSGRNVWWKCPKAPDHEWQKPPDGRVESPRCPFCTSRRVSRDNSLAKNRPDLARQWHPTRNGALSPRDVTTQTNRYVWWKCPRGSDHEWRCTVNSRSGRGGNGCPFCSGCRASRANNLAAVHPKAARYWHPKKNGVLKPTDVTPSTKRLVWWQCPKGSDHQWQCSVHDRVRVAYQCPFCTDRRVSKTNCLAKLYPKIARQWHPKRNGKLKPAGVVATSKDSAWWRCALGHEWFAPVHARTALGKGCPICAESSGFGRLRR
jgi:hypothetical protein